MSFLRVFMSYVPSSSAQVTIPTSLCWNNKGMLPAQHAEGFSSTEWSLSGENRFSLKQQLLISKQQSGNIPLVLKTYWKEKTLNTQKIVSCSVFRGCLGPWFPCHKDWLFPFLWAWNKLDPAFGSATCTPPPAPLGQKAIAWTKPWGQEHPKPPA